MNAFCRLHVALQLSCSDAPWSHCCVLASLKRGQNMLRDMWWTCERNQMKWFLFHDQPERSSRHGVGPGLQWLGRFRHVRLLILPQQSRHRFQPLDLLPLFSHHLRQLPELWVSSLFCGALRPQKLYSLLTLSLPCLRLGKRPVKMPNLKSLRLLFSPFAWQQMKGFQSKCTVLKVGLL